MAAQPQFVRGSVRYSGALICGKLDLCVSISGQSWDSCPITRLLAANWWLPKPCSALAMVQLGPLILASGGTAKLLAWTCLLWLRRVSQQPELPILQGTQREGGETGLRLFGGTHRSGSEIESVRCHSRCRQGFPSGRTTRRQHLASPVAGAWGGSEGGWWVASCSGPRRCAYAPHPSFGDLYKPALTPGCNHKW